MTEAQKTRLKRLIGDVATIRLRLDRVWMLEEKDPSEARGELKKAMYEADEVGGSLSGLYFDAYELTPLPKKSRKGKK